MSERAKSSCGNSPFMGTFHETWSLGTFQAGRMAEQTCEAATSAHPGFLEATGLIQTHPAPVPQPAGSYPTREALLHPEGRASRSFGPRGSCENLGEPFPSESQPQL